MAITCDMTTFAQLSTTGQLTVPAAIRKILGLAPGDPVQISVQGGRMVVEAVVVVTPKNFDELDAALDKIEGRYGEAIARLADL